MIYGPGENTPIFYAPAVAIKPLSTVGCGDAAVAGFAYASCSGASPPEALRKAAACAAANCLAESPGAVRTELVQEFEAQVRVETFLAAP